jgi:hypothetical protein
MGTSKSRRVVVSGLVLALVTTVVFASGSGWSYQAAPSTEAPGPARYPIGTQELAPDRGGPDPTKTETSRPATPTEGFAWGTPLASPGTTYATPFLESTEEAEATPFPEGTGPARFPTPTPTPHATP